jgi:hypothetical protein
MPRHVRRHCVSCDSPPHGNGFECFCPPGHARAFRQTAVARLTAAQVFAAPQMPAIQISFMPRIDPASLTLRPELSIFPGGSNVNAPPFKNEDLPLFSGGRNMASLDQPPFGSSPVSPMTTIINTWYLSSSSSH